MRKTVTIIGQGYVGLPLAFEASAAGWKVYGLDVSETIVSSLSAGVSHVDDLSDEDIKMMLDNGYQATTDNTVISDSEVIVICVPTPLGEAGAPDLGAVIAATTSVGKAVKSGSLVILESTTSPGTTEEICAPILEKHSKLKIGDDILLAFSPERVNPGMKEYGIKNTPKLVGGINNEATSRAAAFYGSFVDTVVRMSGVKEAETAKLLENTFRHVNIALVNELAKVCHLLEIDVWEVIRGAATKPFGFMKFTPGAGVGGHCIPIDPNYLSYEVRRKLGYPLRFVELAQEINNSMPIYVAERVNKALNSIRKPMNGSKVLLLGVTYKKDIADQRQSPAVPVAEHLLIDGVDLLFHDPLVREWNIGNDIQLMREEDLPKAVGDADIVVMLQSHSSYDIEMIEQEAKLFLDTTGTATKPEHRL